MHETKINCSGPRDFDSHIIKLSLRRLGLRFGELEPAIDGFEDDYVVEIFDPEGLQIFRNFKFMESCGHTLFDILTKSYAELYESSKSHLEEYFSNFVRALNGETVIPGSKSKKTYTVRERGTGFSALISYEAFWPLLDIKSGKIKAVMVVSRRHLVPSAPGTQIRNGSSENGPHWLVQALVGSAIYDQLVKPLVESAVEWIQHLIGVYRVDQTTPLIRKLVDIYLYSSRPFAFTPARDFCFG